MKTSDVTSEIDTEIAIMLRFEIRRLRAQLAGRLIVAGDADYAQASAGLGAPGFIVQAAAPGDVAVAQAFAAKYALACVLRHAGQVAPGQPDCTDGVLVEV